MRGDERNTVHMDTLQILQNRAAKIILGRDLRDSATQALKDLNWLTLVKKRTIDRCIFVYKCLNNLIEFDFGFKSFKNRHYYNTRDKQNLAFELSKTNWGFFKTLPQSGKDGTPSTWKPETLTTSFPLRNQLLRFFLSITFFYFTYTFVIFHNLLYIILDILIIYLFIFLTFS